MLDTNERVKKLIEEAIKEGIPVETIRAYLKLTQTPKGAHKDIMDRLYQENSVMPWDLAFFRDTDFIIDEINAQNKVEVGLLEITSETLIDIISINDEDETNEIQEQMIEETSLILQGDTSIFRRILSFFSQIKEGLYKKYAKSG